MKKKLPIRVVVVLLCAAMLCGVPAHAAETRASERIDLSASTIEKTSSGYLLAYFMVQANDVMDVIGATSVEIQRYSLFNWVTEYTFTSEDIPELLTTNDRRHSTGLRYTPLFPNSTYRAVENIYAKDARGTSTQWLPSSPTT